jgi:hypothetical protein
MGVEDDNKAAQDHGDSSEEGCQEAGRSQADADAVVEKGPKQVLLDNF